MSWANEDLLWEFMVTRLRGRWRRLEAVTPEGMPDAFGLFDRQTHWLELKVGKPSRNAIDNKQAEFGLECMKRSVSWHVVFGYKNEVLFFPNLALVAPVKQKFWVSPAERLAESVAKAADEPPWDPER